MSHIQHTKIQNVGGGIPKEIHEHTEHFRLDSNRSKTLIIAQLIKEDVDFLVVQRAMQLPPLSVCALNSLVWAKF